MANLVVKTNSAADTQVDKPLLVSDLLLLYLKQIGVQYVFGIPGGAIEPLYNALARDSRQGGIKAVVARHETGSAFMCDGYTSNSGILGVCCATTGPGATNLVTGVASAHVNQIPMLVITAQTPMETWGKGAFQESHSSEMGVDTMKLFEDITRYNFLVSHVNQVEQSIVSGIRKAFGSPKGPVHLSFPSDVFKAEFPNPKPSYDLLSVINQRQIVDEFAVSQLSDILTSGYKLTFAIGDGCADAIDEILEVATLLNIQFVTTPHGKGLCSPYHPLYRGVIGFAGHNVANESILDDSVRFIIAIGARFGEWDSNRWDPILHGSKLVHISSDSSFFSRTPGAKLHVLGNIRIIFEKVLDSLEDTTLTSMTCDNIAPLGSFASGDRKKYKPTRYFRLIDEDKANDNSSPIKPQRLMKLIARLFPPNTRYLADVGASMAWAIHYCHPYKWQQTQERRRSTRKWCGIFRTCLEFSSMGWAQGAAVGTAFAAKEYPVVCITGDGACLMSGAELTTALQHNLTVIFVVLNDSSLGMVEHGQRLTGAEQIGVELPDVSYAAVAKAMGIQSYTIRSPQDLVELGIKDIANKKGPTLLDCIIDRTEVPPIGLRTSSIKENS